jgi:hypothetical protein
MAGKMISIYDPGRDVYYEVPIERAKKLVASAKLVEAKLKEIEASEAVKK